MHRVPTRVSPRLPSLRAQENKSLQARSTVESEQLHSKRCMSSPYALPTAHRLILAYPALPAHDRHSLITHNAPCIGALDQARDAEVAASEFVCRHCQWQRIFCTPRFQLPDDVRQECLINEEVARERWEGLPIWTQALHLGITNCFRPMSVASVTQYLHGQDMPQTPMLKSPDMPIVAAHIVEFVTKVLYRAHRIWLSAHM